MLMDSVGQEFGLSTAGTLVFVPWCVERQLGRPEGRVASTAGSSNCPETPFHALCLQGQHHWTPV